MKGFKIVLAGEGGQGVQSVANIMVEAANKIGKEALYIPNFGVEQRGGVSLSFVQISDDKIGAPKFNKADIVIALSERAIIRVSEYINDQTILIYDEDIEEAAKHIPKEVGRVIPIPAIKVARTELHPRVFNIIILGALVNLIKIVPLEGIKDALEEKLGYKFAQKPELRELNFNALEKGVNLVQQSLGETK
ncbi:2-oxoglutarate ferredoxin oxidoreductase subunit gamma [Desulfonispora thiosulfatigenes DSM 11270]|uniref:2-oxoglutarate ferredoxin oxidoreductase subunit gamma n=1 Tax=Desulfonispora thiosulfatigenes DSM 11270 TaxID=656914 RepID=A0A1W1V0W6_DESTI|nr:2-oxoacid:acceptor oxidoreductase family protein [Desulfonispora thiosulfatigenes]SMB86989.1 2-oxoglutarate ferredoxin oxidoreductase subunit gamma [Desulfonispora thiosulfatigenes DSM 11270]